MLNDGKLREYFGVEHFDHAFIDLAPPIANTRYVEEDGTMLPEGTFLDVVDEPNGGEVHICLTIVVDNSGLGDVARLWSAANGPFQRHGLTLVDGSGELGRAKDVRDEGVVIKAPNAMGASWLKGVSEDELANNSKVPERIC